MSAAKRRSDPASRRTVAANPEEAAVNQAAERIAELIRSGCSAYVWCSKGPLADEAMRRAGERIDGGRVIELRQPLSSPYIDSFCSQLGNELFGKECLKWCDILEKLQSEKKSRIVISITQRMLAVQNPTENENAFANWLGYFIGVLQELKAVVILGARMPHKEFEELHRSSPQLPFEADQVVPIVFNNDERDSQGEGLEKMELPKDEFRVVEKKLRGSGGESSLKREGKIVGKIRLSRGGRRNKLQFIEIESERLKITSREIWKVIDSALRSANKKNDFVKFDYKTKKLFRTHDAARLLKKMDLQYDPQGKIAGIRFKGDYL